MKQPTDLSPGPSSTLSRSHSIASAGDKSLALPGDRRDVEKNPDRLLHELHVARKQHSDGVKKVDQAIKDVEYYRQEAETLRSRYNDVILEKQRLDQEVASLRRWVTVNNIHSKLHIAGLVLTAFWPKASPNIIRARDQIGFSLNLSRLYFQTRLYCLLDSSDKMRQKLVFFNECQMVQFIIPSLF